MAPIRVAPGLSKPVKILVFVETGLIPKVFSVILNNLTAWLVRILILIREPSYRADATVDAVFPGGHPWWPIFNQTIDLSGSNSRRVRKPLTHERKLCRTL